ncbi:alpha/beta fold hydrolase [Nostoc sp. B(2019)]|nr:alpha/beta fold hydrolase [Nostoc sp. B(2019)]
MSFLLQGGTELILEQARHEDSTKFTAQGRDHDNGSGTTGFIDCPDDAAWADNSISGFHRNDDELCGWLRRGVDSPMILDASGKALAGSIARLEKVRLGGHEQWIMLRGYSTDKPVLLYLSGGPGQSDLPFVRVLLDDLTQNFVVVGWDQRGTGKSYSALDPTETLTLDQAVSDTIALTNYLRQRFDEKKIYLLGESWGSTFGVLAVQSQPELYYAWIGSGQMVSQRETDRRLYQDVLTLAAVTGDASLSAKMRAYGEPPYKDMPYANAFVLGQYDRLSKPYRPPQSYIKRGTEANLGPWGMFDSEYNLVEKVNVLRGLIDMFSVMYPQLQAIDFRQTVKQLEVPVYMLDGAAELPARRDAGQHPAPCVVPFSTQQSYLARRTTLRHICVHGCRHSDCLAQPKGHVQQKKCPDGSHSSNERPGDTG